MSLWRAFLLGFQQRCPICLQQIPNSDIQMMKDNSTTIGLTICLYCWLAGNYRSFRLDQLQYFARGEEDEFIVHPSKPDSLVFRRGEKLQGDSAKVFRNMVEFAKKYGTPNLP